MPGLRLRTSAGIGHIVVALGGELDVSGAAEAEAAITALVTPGRYLVIDMSPLDSIDCSSLGALRRSQEHARRRYGDVVLAAPQPHIRRMLALTGTDEVFWVRASVDAAVADLTSCLLAGTFTAPADTMAPDFDVPGFLYMLTGRALRLVAADAAAVVLAGHRGELRVAAASTTDAGLTELFQLQNEPGPGLDCLRTGQPVTADVLAGPARRWPRFARAATQAGIRTVQALPMRRNSYVTGALTLFRAEPGPFRATDRRIAQSLADVASIGLRHERNKRRAEPEALDAGLHPRPAPAARLARNRRRHDAAISPAPPQQR